MRAFSTNTPKLAGLVASMFVIAACASADTIATFADPAPSGDTPLFLLSDDTLNGGWAGTGLDLLTPITADVYPNATFTMSELTVDGTGLTNAGNIEFHDAGGALILRIDFDSAHFWDPFGFGASDLVTENVMFSGPLVTTPLVDEAFAFSFANRTVTPEGVTWTAAFTSSAIPEPSTAVLLGVGLVILLRRR